MRLLGVLGMRQGHGADSQAALERALDCARRANDERREKNIVVTLGDAMNHGPATVRQLQELYDWQAAREEISRRLGVDETKRLMADGAATSVDDALAEILGSLRAR